MNGISFGTDGWRSLMTGDFTRENVVTVAQAVAQYVKSGSLIVGYDCRNYSHRFAQDCCAVFTENGITALLCDRPTPTPVVTHAVAHHNLQGAIMITASHNPPAYNGIKFIPSYAGPATDDITGAIESVLSALDTDTESWLPGETSYESIDPYPAYEAHVLDCINTRIISKTNPEIVFNPMHGAAYNYSRLFEAFGCHVQSINDTCDPQFGGKNPDPTEAALQDQVPFVSSAQVGIALDGDADRIGIMDPTGAFISPNALFALLLYYLRERPGDVCRTVSTTHWIDAIAKDQGKTVYEVPVGFKYVGETMRTHSILMGGEESGGFSFKGHIPEKDGLLTALYVIEACCTTGKSPLELLKEVRAHYGERWNAKCSVSVDTHIDLSSIPSHMRENIIKTDTKDGLKVYLESGWILFRPSGTEPVFRIYAESDSPERTQALLRMGKHLLNQSMDEKSS
ncbi:MAG: phosphoglucomutase/phosphomannomutase family protein [Theionarchaea archaeon]|nr:phosphoglucomutase/phosphomannomutase family protein [Theionarchaea archaeon]